MGRKRRRRQDDDNNDKSGSTHAQLAPTPTPAAAAASGVEVNGNGSDGHAPAKRCATMNPLTARELAAFVRDGFVLLRDAFPREVAAQCRERIWQRLAHDGIHKDDPTTWVERHGIPEIYTGEQDTLWDHVLTSTRLTRAVDQLCGADAWEPFGCGWWMITFPDQSEPPWGAAGKWHVDGASYQHHVDSRESGLLAIMCFSDVAATEGGTALAVGSHTRIAQLLARHEPRGLKGGAVSFHARQWPRAHIVEVNARAGDVMLVHPFMLHARSKNLGQRGVESVRVMCNPNIRLHRAMNLHRTDGAYSPVEQAIVNALDSEQE